MLVCVTSLFPSHVQNACFTCASAEPGPPLCHVPFVRRGTNAPCSIDMKPHKDEPNLQIICSLVPQPGSTLKPHLPVYPGL